MTTNNSKVHDYYKAVSDATNTVRVASTVESATTFPALAKSHSFVSDFERVSDILHSRPEASMLVAACREYQFALVAITSGLYRPAYASLRLSLELALGGIRFSGQEVYYRNWLLDEKDLSWSEIVDLDNGIYSPEFVRAFQPNFGPIRLEHRANAISLYRDCSEFVHGNALANQSLPDTISYSAATVAAWHAKAAEFCKVLLFAICLRHASFLSPAERGVLEPIAIDHLGHVEPVRAIFSDSGTPK